MELPALDSIRNAAKVFEKLQAPPNTSCALQAAFLRNVLIQHEAIQERRTYSLSHMPAAHVAPTPHQSATTHTQTVQSTVIRMPLNRRRKMHQASILTL
jgi:hypothetical protein